jgi:hypothetical protein
VALGSSAKAAPLKANRATAPEQTSERARVLKLVFMCRFSTVRGDAKQKLIW